MTHESMTYEAEEIREELVDEEYAQPVPLHDVESILDDYKRVAEKVLHMTWHLESEGTGADGDRPEFTVYHTKQGHYAVYRNEEGRQWAVKFNAHGYDTSIMLPKLLEHDVFDTETGYWFPQDAKTERKMNRDGYRPASRKRVEEQEYGEPKWNVHTEGM